MVRMVRKMPDGTLREVGAKSSENDTPKTEVDLFRELVGRANRGDKAALVELRKTLDRCPKLWHDIGDLATMARNVMIKAIAAGDRLLLESLRRSAEELEKELAGEDPSPLLRLAAQRFTACWLQVQHADAAAAASGQKTDFTRAKFWSDQQDRSSKRYEKALSTLRQIIETDERAKNSRQPEDGECDQQRHEKLDSLQARRSG